MELGDFAELKSLAIEVGSVFRMTMYPEDKVTPKKMGDTSRDKYFVVIGKTEDAVVVGSLLINTNINSRMFNLISPYQHCISPDAYDFLDIDASIDLAKKSPINDKRTLKMFNLID